jgi:RHS repeat-associated protein
MPRLITNSDGVPVWTWDGEAFGNTPPTAETTGAGPFVFNLRFPGQYADAETGLFYNFFRDYDPSTGRYVESDPIGLFSGVSTFNYVGGNPLSNSDRQGLAPDYSTFLQNHPPVPADSSASACPTGKCVHTVSINHPGVCDGQDATCCCVLFSGRTPSRIGIEGDALEQGQWRAAFFAARRSEPLTLRKG